MRSLSFFLDILYPPRCVACGAAKREEGARGWWCTECRDAVEVTPRDPCPRCLSVEATHDRAACEGALPFYGVVATGFYHSLPLRRLVADVKYQGVTATAVSVEAYARTFKERRNGVLPWAQEEALAVVPMPLATSRERQRGFNQAAWVAERLCAAWDIHDALPHGTAASLLLRRKTTSTQAELGHDERMRQANIRGAFQATRPVTTPVLLVDDVITTGATAAEAARALQAVGSPRIYLAALALGK